VRSRKCGCVHVDGEGLRMLVRFVVMVRIDCSILSFLSFQFASTKSSKVISYQEL
jgi:hypothetical protein